MVIDSAKNVYAQIQNADENEWVLEVKTSNLTTTSFLQPCLILLWTSGLMGDPKTEPFWWPGYLWPSTLWPPGTWSRWQATPSLPTARGWLTSTRRRVTTPSSIWGALDILTPNLSLSDPKVEIFCPTTLVLFQSKGVPKNEDKRE